MTVQRVPTPRGKKTLPIVLLQEIMKYTKAIDPVEAIDIVNFFVERPEWSEHAGKIGDIMECLGFIE